MKTIQLKKTQDANYIQGLVDNSVQPTVDDYDFLAEETVTMLKPNGEILLQLIRKVLPPTYVKAAWEAFHDKLAAKKNSQRTAIVSSANDGAEGVLGYMDPVFRFNYCRTTALTTKHLEGYQAALPMIRAAGEVFAKHLPLRHDAQANFCQMAHPHYVIPHTPFSTVTMNRDVTATYHRDRGDLKAGFGVIAATWAAKGKDGWEVVMENPAEGGQLVFPEFRVAVKVRTRDVLLCDVHEVHGVTPIVGTPGEWARMSFVFYCREKINKCRAPLEEIEKAAVADTAKYFGGRSADADLEQG